MHAGQEMTTFQGLFGMLLSYQIHMSYGEVSRVHPMKVATTVIVSSALLGVICEDEPSVTFQYRNSR